MRSAACVQPVDGLSKNCVRFGAPDPSLHSTQGRLSQESAFYPHHPQNLTTVLSTAIFEIFNLLLTDLSTLYTGLITNTTK
jgi:hypothetical protein